MFIVYLKTLMYTHGRREGGHKGSFEKLVNKNELRVKIDNKVKLG